jgi:hypothetical protein
VASQQAPSSTDAAQQHQQGQAALVEGVGPALTAAWVLWNAKDVAPFTAAVTAVVDRYGKASAVAAREHYLQQRKAAGIPGRPPRLTVAPTAPDGQIAAAVNWAVQGVGAPDAASNAADVALSNITGATERLVLDQGRETIIEAVHTDPAATGWARIPELGACSFCLMLATRGAVYEEHAFDEANKKFTGAGKFKSHNHCACHADPSFVPRKQYALTPEVIAARDLYRSTPAGQNAAEKRRNFRHAVEAQPPGATWKESHAAAKDAIPARMDDLGSSHRWDGLGFTTDPELVRAHVASLRDPQAKALYEARAKADRLAALYRDLNGPLSYNGKVTIPAPVARRLRAEGISTRGGYDKVMVSLQSEQYAANAARSQAEYLLAHPVSVSRVVDLTKDGELGERSATALRGTIDAGKALDEEIQRRLGPLSAPSFTFDTATATASDNYVAAKKAVEDAYSHAFNRALDAVDTLPFHQKVDAKDEIMQHFLVSPEYTALTKAQGKALDEWSAAGTAGAKYKIERGAAYARETRAVLDELRGGMGGELHYTGDPAADLVASMRQAESNYPTEWLDRARRRNPDVNLRSSDRGYNSGGAEISLSRYETGTLMHGDQTATHELGHTMEHAVPGLKALEWAYHYQRTSSVVNGRRTQESPTDIFATDIGMGHERAAKDDFAHVYSGKMYSNADADTNRELFTTGVEAIFHGAKYFTRERGSGVFEDDPEYRAFVLGALSVL